MDKSTIKKIFKIISRIFVLFLILIAIYILVPAYPHLLFKHKIEHGNFTVYSDKKFPDNINEILANTQFRIENLEIYDSTFHPDIFICSDEDLYHFFSYWVRMNPNSQGLNLSLFNNSFVNLTKVNGLKYYHDQRLKYTHLTGNLSQVIAHELVHNLDSRYSGYWNYMEKPVWKREGYCEFGSTIALIKGDEKYDLFNRSSFLFENDLFNAPNHSKYYYRAQIMVEYLFTEEEFTFEMLNDSSVTEESVIGMLKDWYYQKKEEINADQK